MRPLAAAHRTRMEHNGKWERLSISLEAVAHCHGQMLGSSRPNSDASFLAVRLLGSVCGYWPRAALLEVRFHGLKCPSRVRAVGADVALASSCSQCRSRTDQIIHWGATRQTEINTPGPIFVGGESSGAASPRSEIAVMTAQLSYTLVDRSIHNRSPVAEFLLTPLGGVSSHN